MSDFASKVGRADRGRPGFTLLELLIAMGIIATLAAITLTVGAGLFVSSEATQTETLLRITAAQIDEVLGVATRPDNSQKAAMDRYRAQTAQHLAGRWPYSTTPPTPPPAAEFVSPAAFEYLAAKMTREAILPQSFADLCGLDGLPGQPGVGDPGSIRHFNGTDTVPPRPYGPVVGPDSDYIHRSDGTVTSVLDISQLGLGRPYSDDPPTADLFREYVRRLDAGGVLRDANGNSLLVNHLEETESSEILYAIMTTKWMGAEVLAGEDQISANFVADTDGDGLPELIDSWGTPLQFYTSNASLVRPTSLASGFTFAVAGARPDYPVVEATPLQALAPRMTRSFTRDTTIVGGVRVVEGTDYGAAFNQDPDDPLNIIDAARRAGTGGVPVLLGSDAVTYTQYPKGISASNAIFPSVTAPAYTGPVGVMSRYMIVSAGQDGQLGMFLPTETTGVRYAEVEDPANFGGGHPATDNITNLQVGGL